MTILFAGGEDVDFTPAGNVLVSTTAGHFRSGFARCALSCTYGAQNLWRALNVFTATSFWLGCRLYNASSATDSSNSSAAADLVRLTDSQGTPRLVVRNLSSVLGSIPSDFVVQKINAAGTRTQIGAAFTSGFSLKPAVPDKLDIAVNYAVAGSITVYINGYPVFTFSGDVTTDGTTSLAGFDLGNVSTFSNSVSTDYSEAVVADTDTRTLAVITYAPSALGTTAQWNGTAVSVSETALSDTDGLDTATAGNVEELTTTGTLPAGATFSVPAVVVATRAATTSGSPQHLDLGLGIGGTDYWSSDLAVPGAFSRIANRWATNPATGVAWTQSDLGALSIALKAVA